METNFERLNAIRKMLYAEDGASITLSTGEVIRSWAIWKEDCTRIGISEISDAELINEYNEVQSWNCPEEFK